MVPSKPSDIVSDVVVKYSDVTVPDIAATKNISQMYGLFGLQDYYELAQKEFEKRSIEFKHQSAGDVPTHVYDDEFLVNRKFFCEPCNLQLLSDKDVALHIKGKRHKKKTRTLASQTAFSNITGNKYTTSLVTEGIPDPANKRAKLEE